MKIRPISYINQTFTQGIKIKRDKSVSKPQDSYEDSKSSEKVQFNGMRNSDKTQKIVQTYRAEGKAKKEEAETKKRYAQGTLYPNAMKIGDEVKQAINRKRNQEKTVVEEEYYGVILNRDENSEIEIGPQMYFNEYAKGRLVRRTSFDISGNDVLIGEIKIINKDNIDYSIAYDYTDRVTSIGEGLSFYADEKKAAKIYGFTSEGEMDIYCEGYKERPDIELRTGKEYRFERGKLAEVTEGFKSLEGGTCEYAKRYLYNNGELSVIEEETKEDRSGNKTVKTKIDFTDDIFTTISRGYKKTKNGKETARQVRMTAGTK